MIAFGVGEILGGILMGKLFDYFGAYKCVFINLICIVVMGGVTIYAVYIERFTYVSFLMTFMWGVQDGFFNIHGNSIIGSEFT